MIFYRVNWHEDDTPDGTAEEVFDSLKAARAFARKKAIEDAEVAGDGGIFCLWSSSVPTPVTRAVVKALLEGCSFGSGMVVEEFQYERRCRRCKHTTMHEDSEDEDACASCFADRIEEKDVCRDPDWVVRRLKREVKS